MSINQTIQVQRELRRKINNIPKDKRLEFFSKLNDLLDFYQPKKAVD